MQRNIAGVIKNMSPKEEIPEPIFTISLKEGNNNGIIGNEQRIENETKQNDDSDNKSKKKKVSLLSLHFKKKLMLLLLCTADFMAYAAIALLSPFFPKEAEEKGMSKSMFGYAFSFPSLVLFLASPVVSKLIPRFGERIIYNIGFSMVGICHIAFGALEYVNNYTWYVFLCFFVRGLQALGASGYITVSFVYASKVFPECPGFVRGTLETFVGLGLSIGPAIGGLLYSVGGFGLPFYVMGAAALIVIPLNLSLFPTSLTRGVEERKESMWRMIKIPSVFINCLIILVVSMTWGFMEPSLEPHIRKFNLTPMMVGLIFLMLAGVYALSSPGWGWVADRVNGHWSLMALGMFANAVALLLIGPSPFLPFIHSSLVLIVVCLCCMGLTTSMALIPTFNAFVVYALESGYEDSVTTHSIIAGLWSSAYALGEVIGPATGGVLVETYGYEISSTIFALINMVLVVICLIYFNLDRLKRKSKKSPENCENGNDQVLRDL